jgi:hypothetical protein
VVILLDFEWVHFIRLRWDKWTTLTFCNSEYISCLPEYLGLGFKVPISENAGPKGPTVLSEWFECSDWTWVWIWMLIRLDMALDFKAY